VGIAFLAGVILIATHFSEQQKFFHLMTEADPLWILVAVLLQAATYLAQGKIWTATARAVKRHLPLALAYKLALAKLFVDQALPSAGISGTVVVAQVLESGPLPKSTILAGVVINTTSFFIAYAVSLIAAAGIALASGHTAWWILGTCVFFTLLSIALTIGLLKISGKEIPKRPGWLVRNKVVQNALKIVEGADTQLTHSVRLQTASSCYQLATFLLDAATLWVLLVSLGSTPSPADVFASFMVSNVVRTVSFVPGGLGTFEGALLLMLRESRVPVETALAAALLFRGLTFFLPMLPGLWFSHSLARKAHRSAGAG
jgi:uncharacterized protein (TIRG00374 family)